jgi:hypothetical protein
VIGTNEEAVRDRYAALQGSAIVNPKGEFSRLLNG